MDTDISLNADPDAEILSLLSGGITGVDNGIAAVEDGKIRFTPTSNWNGSPETFTYTMRDAAGQTSSASVTVTVNQKNDIPSAASDSFNSEEEETAILDVLSNDTDIDMNSFAERLARVGNPFHKTGWIYAGGSRNSFYR